MSINPAPGLIAPAASAAYTGTAGSTTATWPNTPQNVLVWTTTDAYVVVGAGVTATVNDCPIPAFTPVLFAVPYNTTGAPWRVSAIQVSSAGTVYAKPCIVEV